MTGYHAAYIHPGKYGEASKVFEEVEELMDAVAQNNKIMALLELADIYGAIQGFLSNKFPGMTMKDLEIMSETTSRAFLDGTRTPKN